MKINNYTESVATTTERLMPKSSQPEITEEPPQSLANPTDTVEISRAVQKKQTAIEEQMRMESEIERLKQQLENSNAQAESAAKEAKTRLACMMIAMRIQGGDDVTEADKRYLAKNDFGLYARAISLRIEKEKPQKIKQISEDEDDNAAQASGAPDAAQAAGSQEIAQSAVVDIPTVEVSSPEAPIA